MRPGQGGPSVVSSRRPLPLVQTSVLLTGPAPAVAWIRRRRADRVPNGSVVAASPAYSRNWRSRRSVSSTSRPCARRPLSRK